MNSKGQPRKLILASASPRRRELLTRAGYVFDVVPCDEEEVIKAEHPALAGMMAAKQKALCVSKRFQNTVTIGADTLVVCEGEILLKPQNPSDAFRMLRLLRNNFHIVYTGVAVIDTDTNREEIFFEETAVFFRDITEDEIEYYVNTGEPLDKAGAYGIQEIGACFVRRIEGCYFNVVGLPVPHLCSVLSKFSLSPFNGG